MKDYGSGRVVGNGLVWRSGGIGGGVGLCGGLCLGYFLGLFALHSIVLAILLPIACLGGA